MGTNKVAGSYDRPAVTVVGTLREDTELRNKCFSSTSDFHYPNGYMFNFS
jgi:hypothetical protein